MYALREREGIMATRSSAPPTEAPPVELLNGLVHVPHAGFEEPYPDDEGG
jgi:hypothetical protein